jgi:hypothetical protein
MLFICYFEILPEQMEKATERTRAHSGKKPPAGVKLLFEAQSPSHWGIAAFEADSEEAVFNYIRPWASVNGKILVAPALRVDTGDFAAQA